MKNNDAGKDIGQADQGVKRQDTCLSSKPSGKKCGWVVCQNTGQDDVHFIESRIPELGDIWKVRSSSPLLHL